MFDDYFPGSQVMPQALRGSKTQTPPETLVVGLLVEQCLCAPITCQDDIMFIENAG